MPPLGKKTLEEFLKGGRIAKIATLKKDGSPHITPAWYEWDGKHLYVVTKPHAQVVENVKSNRRVYVLIDKSEWPYMRVNFEGEAQIVDIEWAEMLRRLTLRYMGEQALKYHEERLKYPSVVIKITPKRISTWVPTTFPPDRTFFKPAVWREFKT